ncbi:MAG: TonB-dependent receptor plug domain-containing protein [Bacteroidota bacterium]
MDRQRILFYACLLSYLTNIAQETENDSVWAEEINEVIVTGQYNPQTIKKSIFEVKVIDQETIEQLAANNLADVLNQSLNLTITPNASTGKSSVQLFGLDGQYVKILVDNIPLVNDEGFGNNTDLTQINVDDIERIEIVEGSMGVEYGANAISGVINIITKKSTESTLDLQAYIQEESIGNEYNFEDQGRHIQSIRIAGNPSKNWFTSTTFTRNNFSGLYGNRKGENYENNDGLRGFEWLPKEQNTIKALVSHQGKLKVFYKFEWFNEQVNRYNQEVRNNYNPSTQTTNPTASDEIFFSNRMYHHLNTNGSINNQVNYDLAFSYQYQKRDIETYNYRIRNRERFNINRTEFESRNVLFSRGRFSNFFNFENIKFETGYDVSSTFGYASPLSNPLSNNQIRRTLSSYDLIASSEINATDRLSFRPGGRLMLSNQFDALLAASLTTRYNFNEGYEARLVLGSSPRTPSYEELFTYFVDSNHDVRGNENLSPENGISAFLHLKKVFGFNDYETLLRSKISTWYLSVSDRIELTVINPSPLAYQFNNIDKYTSWGIGTEQSIQHKNLTAGFGISLNGVSKILDSQDNFNDDYLYAIQSNLNLSYRVPKWKTTFAAYLKHNGPQYQFVQRENDAGELTFVRGKLEAFSWLDATIKKSFLDQQFEVTLGARNLLDITEVNSSTTQGAAHSDAGSSQLLGYGRSFFIRVMYNLNI